MHSFNLKNEEQFDPRKHVERVLGRVGEGDVTIACWEPGQTSPYHCHPHATEIYFCFEGGGTMKTPSESDRPTEPNAGFVRYEPGAHHPLHRHDFAQVWYILEGDFTIGGRTFGPGTMLHHPD